METKEPIECPFCGCTDVEPDGSDDSWYVCCNMCGAIGPDGVSADDAVEFWNERVVLDDLR